MAHDPIILAPKGMPWRSLLIGLVVLGVAIGIGHTLFPTKAFGGIFIVSALLGIGSFAATLG